MIDAHCHLEQKDFDCDRDEAINSWKGKIKAVVTSCARPKDFDVTIETVKKHRGFVFATFGLHPEYIKEISEKEKKEYLDKIRKHKEVVSGIGEIGLDYFWIKENEWHEKQKILFREMLSFAKELDKPVVIHSRDASEDCIKLLEDEKRKNVLMHLFGAKEFLSRVEKNGWHISIGPVIARSKTHRKIARDFPLERILLETDSPWFGDGKRGTPLNINIAAEKIADAKKITKDDVMKKCGENAIRFFQLDKYSA